MTRGLLFYVVFASAAIIAMIAFGLSSTVLVEEEPAYRVFYVEDMPCITIPRHSGISCDWDKWKE